MGNYITFYERWQRHRKVATGERPRNNYVSIDNCRDEMESRIEKHLAAGDNGMLIVNVPAGVGKSYAAKLDYSRAINDFNVAIRLSPYGAAAYFHRGVAYLNLGKNESALEDFAMACRLDRKYCQ